MPCFNHSKWKLWLFLGLLPKFVDKLKLPNKSRLKLKLYKQFLLIEIKNLGFIIISIY